MADAATPKLDPKMLILPLVFIFGKKIDWKDPFVGELACFLGSLSN
jgi:hypothetical protein